MGALSRHLPIRLVTTLTFVSLPLLAGLALTWILSRNPPWLFDAPDFIAHGAQCGIDRLAVKTLSDPDATYLNLSPVRTTVRELVRLERPDSPPTDVDLHRIAPVELTTYLVRALAVEFKPDSDNNTELIIADPSDFSSTMLAEFVYWDCAGTVDSKYKEDFKIAFAQLHSLFGDRLSPSIALDGQTLTLADWFDPRSVGSNQAWPSGALPSRVPPAELIESALVEITGVGFFDWRTRRVKGAALNGIQLHPVLSIKRVQ